MLGVTRRDIASLINGKSRPKEETTSAGISPALAGYNRANEIFYAIIYLLTEKTAALLVAKHEDTTGTSGDQPKALQELVDKYNKVADEVIRATMERLVNTSVKQGQDTDDYLMGKTLARTELEKMGEPIPDGSFKDFGVQGFTVEYKDIKLITYRDPTFDTNQMQSTMRHLYLDNL